MPRSSPRILALLIAAAMIPAMGTSAFAQEKEPDGEPPSDAPPATPAPAADPVSLPSAAPAQPAATNENVPEGKQLLQRAAAAFKKVKAVSFKAKQYAAGGDIDIGALLGTTEGSVKMFRKATPSGSTVPFYWVIRAQGIGGRSKAAFDAAWIGQDVEWADSATKKVFQKNDKAAHSPVVMSAKYLKLDDIIAAEPFTKDLGATEFTVEDSRVIGGVNCDVVVTLASSVAKTKTRWFLGADDYFPRRLDKIIISPKGRDKDTITTVELSDVVLETTEPTSITEAQCRIAIPEGFVEERDPASPVGAPAPKPAPAPAPPTHPDPAATSAEATAGTPATPVIDAPPPAPPAPTIAPSFSLKDVSGKPQTLEGLLTTEGTQALVLDFFGTWCVHIKNWHPVLDEVVKERASKGVVMVTMATREKDMSNLTDYMSKSHRENLVLVNAYETAKAYGVRTYPAAAIVSRDGRLIGVIQGASADSRVALEDLIADALGEARPARIEENHEPNPDAKPDAKSEAVPLTDATNAVSKAK
jgi:thiol-disulfide isomerase/thioredoxin